MHYLLTLEVQKQSSLFGNNNRTSFRKKLMHFSKNVALVKCTKVAQGHKDILTHCCHSEKCETNNVPTIQYSDKNCTMLKAFMNNLSEAITSRPYDVFSTLCCSKNKETTAHLKTYMRHFSVQFDNTEHKCTL